MTDEDFRSLREGDTVRHKTSSQKWLVTSNYGTRVTAVQTKDLTNHDEWDIATKVIARAEVSG